MSGVAFEWGKNLLVVMGTGLSVKLMDDFLDEERDGIAGIRNWAQLLGRSIMAYSLLALAVATALNPAWAVSLFLASYAVGMAHEHGERLPSGLKSYQEAMLALAAGWFLFGPTEMVTSLVLVIFLQAVDDLRDWRQDRELGRQSLVTSLGPVEAVLLAGIMLVLSGSLDLPKTLVVSGAGILFTMPLQLLKGWRHN